MLHGKVFFIGALLAALFFDGAAMAQESNPDCEGAKQYLVHQYSRLNPAENEKYYQIWASSQCVQDRKNAELNVDPAIASNEQFIRSITEDYDARLANIPAICKSVVEKRWSAASSQFRAEQKKSELVTSCIRNRSHALRGEFLHRLNEQSAAQHAENLRLNEEKIAADRIAEAERQAEYERKMDEWREAVERCNAGEIRYCSARF